MGGGAAAGGGRSGTRIGPLNLSRTARLQGESTKFGSCDARPISAIDRGVTTGAGAIAGFPPNIPPVEPPGAWPLGGLTLMSGGGVLMSGGGVPLGRLGGAAAGGGGSGCWDFHCAACHSNIPSKPPWAKACVIPAADSGIWGI